jgi:hypothetical protein
MSQLQDVSVAADPIKPIGLLGNFVIFWVSDHDCITNLPAIYHAMILAHKIMTYCSQHWALPAGHTRSQCTSEAILYIAGGGWIVSIQSDVCVDLLPLEVDLLPFALWPAVTLPSSSMCLRRVRESVIVALFCCCSYGQ